MDEELNKKYHFFLDHPVSQSHSPYSSSSGTTAASLLLYQACALASGDLKSPLLLSL